MLGPPGGYAVGSMIESNNTLVHLALRGRSFIPRSELHVDDSVCLSLPLSLPPSI